MKRFIISTTHWSLILVMLGISFSKNLQAQEEMRVVRCNAIDQRNPIVNIFVDDSNQKWVATTKGVFQVQALDLVSPAKLGAGEQSLASIRGGNENLSWSSEELKAIIGADRNVSAAFYDKKKDELWIGTREAGAFQLRVKPKLQLINKFDNTNSKLKANEVNSIFIDQLGEVWIGTEEGALVGKGNRWTLEERLLSIGRITEYNSNVWVIGNNAIWKVTSRGDWIPVEVDASKVEGDIHDIALDSAGRVWIASEVITRFDPKTDEYGFFGPIQYFTSQLASCLVVDKEGAVWVGTTDKGLYLIEKASAITVNIVAEKALGCDATKNDAALKVKITGGKAPYTYAWTSGLSGDNPQNLGPGEYTLTVTDSEGKTKSVKATIENPRFTVQLKQDKEESAAGAGDGAATVTTVGNATDFTFKWDNGETTKTAQKLTTGNHSVTVTDKKGCSAIGMITIGQQLATLAIAFDLVNPILCNGDSNAAVKVNITGGKQPYQIKWSDPKITGEQPTGIGVGAYQLEVVDAAGNKVPGILNITAPPAIAITTQVQAPASTGNADGKAIAQVKGGTGNYNYKWDNGETTATATKLAPGKHNLTVTDANSCAMTATVEILENVLPLSIVINEKSNIKCAGDATASVEAQISGGKAPYQYSWSDPKLTGNAPKNIAAGNYQVTVTDATGNKLSAPIVIKAPEAITATVQAQAPASTGNADGKALAQAKGGNGNFTYQWDNGETTATAIKLAPGKRTVTIRDANGCAATASVEITENILPLVVTLSEKESAKCANKATAALEVKASGGKKPYDYKWNDTKLSGDGPAGLMMGTYEVTVTDAAGNKTSASIAVKFPEAITATVQAQAPASTGNSDGKAIAQVKGGVGNYAYKWDNGETTQTATKLAPGKHSLTITDANGCTGTAAIEITENILPLSVVINEKNSLKCAGDATAAITTQVAGGKAPFQYQWSDSKLSGNAPANLSAGNYQLTVTDAAGNKSNASISIKAPEAITATIQVQAPASTGNADGKAIAQAKGGNGNYAYKWDNGETNANANKLAPGKHNLTITDANGCTAIATMDVSENILPLTLTIAEKAKIKCADGSDAALQVQVSGGKPPFQYMWNNPKANGDQPTGLAAGDYEVSVTDATGAIKSAKFAIIQPNSVQASISNVKMATSTTVADGKATVEAKGGAGNYSFKWNNGETSAAAAKLPPGNNSVTITDANGCTAIANVETPQRILAELSGAVRSGQTIRMEQLVFQADSSTIQAPSMPVLNELYEFLQENASVFVEIGGHTNSLPPDAVCDRLSTDRAKSVVEFLIDKGIAEGRLSYKGYGKRVPIADNGTAEGRQKNQRVEIKILRVGKPKETGG